MDGEPRPVRPGLSPVERDLARSDVRPNSVTLRPRRRARRAGRSRSPLARFLPAGGAPLPKYAQLRRALTAALDAGFWKPGDRLPTEIELTGMVPFSLGTVQKGVRALVDEGRLLRVKGRGTFVTADLKGIAQPFLHARFLDDSGAGMLALHTKVVSRRRISATGPWSRPLGQSGDNVVRLERELRIGREFTVFSRFYINADRFAAFAAKPLAALRDSNLKLMLARDYNLPPITFSQELTFAELGGEIARHLRIRAGTTGIKLAITATCRRSDAVYFHELFVPPNRRRLVLPDITLPTGR